MFLEPLAREFRALASQGDESIDLVEGALLIAALYHPRLDRSSWRQQLNALATAAAAALEPGGPVRRARQLARWLFQEQRFRGNTLDYYDPRNSFLPDVLRRRLGIPLTLALLYLEVARQLGIPAFGAPVPGHFVIGVATLDGPLFFDPFGGAELTPPQLAVLASRATGRPVAIEPFLRPAAHRAILMRMLQNLKAIYLAREAWEFAYRALDWILLLAPASPLDRRDRGLIAYRLGQYGVASEDFQRYLAVFPRGEESERLSRLLASLAS
ncbi:MAG: tetratricopeptide repeat protein [Chloroflexi bacterium]|nr:tetratricopeptide repeat protein [Chloroflexota bacterium]